MPKPGLYKHYKTGNKYRVHYCAKHSETLEDMVVYEALYQTESRFWVRPVVMFMESVEWPKGSGTEVPRFEYIHE